MSVREALALINQTLDEVARRARGRLRRGQPLGADLVRAIGLRRGRLRCRRDALKGKEHQRRGMVEAGILTSSGGKVRLLKPGELPCDWDPATDKRLTAWEIVHHLIRALEAGGERGCGDCREAREQRPRPPATRLPPLHDLRAEEARCGSPFLQRTRPELARDHAPGARRREAEATSRPACSKRIRGIAMAITNHERVGKALELLKAGLGPSSNGSSERLQG